MSTGRDGSTNRSIDSRSDSDNDMLSVDIANYDCNELKSFLDAVYNYRGPRDKIGQDKRFLKLLKQAEDEEKNLRVVSSSLASVRTTSNLKIKEPEPNNSNKSLDNELNLGEKPTQARSKCPIRMYCNGYGPENDDESVHLNDDSFDDIGVLRQSDDNSDYSDDSDESEHLSSMAKGLMPLCMDKVLSSKAEHARNTKRKLAEIRESMASIQKSGQENDPQTENKMAPISQDDATKKSKHATRRSRRETEIKIDYYSTNNIDALVYHINSGATSTIEEALAVTTTNHQNKTRPKSSRMKKYRSFEDLRNTKKSSNNGSKKNSAGATPSLPSANQQKSKLKKSSSLENLNNNNKKKNASKHKRNTSSEVFLEGVASTTSTTTIDDSVLVQQLPIKVAETGVIDQFDDFHEVKKRRKKTRSDVTNPVEKPIKKTVIKATKSAPPMKSTKIATATPTTTTTTNCDTTKPVQLVKSSSCNDDKKSSYAEIMKNGRLTTADSNNNSITEMSPVNGYDRLDKKLIVINGDSISTNLNVDTDTNNHTLIWVSKYYDKGEYARFHEQFVSYLYNAWLDTLNKSPPFVYYTESLEVNV